MMAGIDHMPADNIDALIGLHDAAANATPADRASAIADLVIALTDATEDEQVEYSARYPIADALYALVGETPLIFLDQPVPETSGPVCGPAPRPTRTTRHR